jgi:hypothetical protein
MKKLTSGTVLVLMAMLFTGMFTVLPAYAVTEIYLDPATNPPTADPYIGYKWTVTAWLVDVSDLWAFQVKVIITNESPYENIVNITNCWKPLGDPQYVFYGLTTVGGAIPDVLDDPDSDSYMEEALVGDSLVSGQTPVTGAGPFKLAVFEFEITAAPGKYETLTCDFSIDNADTYLLDSSLAQISTLKTGATYEWAWQPPEVNPYMAVVPDLLEFDQYHDWIGTTFDVDIYIMQLDVGWALHNASFKLSYNNTLTEIVSIVVDPLWVDVILDTSVPGVIDFFGNASTTPSGDVLVFTVTFSILTQGASPPRAVGAYDKSDLVFYDVVLMNTVGPITTEPSVNGEVRVYCKLALPLPWLEVVPAESILGPDLVVGDQYGKTFQVAVDIKSLHFAWYLVGVQFRLSFDTSLVEVVNVEEGPYLAQFNNTVDPPYTYFISYVELGDPIYGDHVLVGDLLLPNAEGEWTVFPGGDWVMGDEPIPPEANGTIAIITFRPLVQSWTETYTGEFNIIQVVLADQNADPISYDPPQNGTLTILPIEAVGRMIDVWMQYPSPYGGQGLMNPADLVVPQQLITLTAKVTYNWWPVPQKLVTFHVYDDDGNLFTNLQGMTDDYGHVTVEFRMPYYNAEDFFGVWTVNATVEVAEEVVFDIMQFHFDWLVRTWKVTTDKEEYMHLETIYITVEYGTHAQQNYEVTLKIAIFDELGYSIGIAYASLTIGGAGFNYYKNRTAIITIRVSRQAAAGQATIKVYFLQGGAYSGTAITPEAEKTIWILPL